MAANTDSNLMIKLSTQELNRINTAEFQEMKKFPIVLVLDNVRSMHNIGSAFRTADAFAITKICLCGITAQPPHREIDKTALGATNSVNWEYFEHTAAAISQLKNDGYQVWAIEQLQTSQNLQEFEPQSGVKYALVFGNEVSGVSDEALAECIGGIEIPQFGTKHSFNIVISIGIVVWDFFSKLKFH